jgi:hypothetical protein
MNRRNFFREAVAAVVSLPLMALTAGVKNPQDDCWEETTWDCAQAVEGPRGIEIRHCKIQVKVKKEVA